MNRRSFLSRLLFAATPILSPAAAASSARRHTLVVIFLRGGADTLNMVIPYRDDRYYQQRPGIAVARPDAAAGASLKLDDHYAFHPALQPMLPWFKEGQLAIVQGVGTDNVSGSHFDCQDQMEHGESMGHPVGGGWLARYLQQRTGQLSPLAAVSISPTLPESLRGAPAATALRSLNDLEIKAPGGKSDAVTQALAKLYGAETGLMGSQGVETLAVYQKIRDLRQQAYVPANRAEYPQTSLGSSLREVARLIKADLGLEVACVDVENWDTHFVQGAADGLQAGRIKELADGTTAFWQDIKQDMPNVTTIIMTEFGRRLYENSSAGTDHGRGFALMACGGPVKGGSVLGPWPIFEEEAGPGPGGMKVIYDYRSVLGEVLGKVGDTTALSKIFPGFVPQAIGLA